MRRLSAPLPPPRLRALIPHAGGGDPPSATIAQIRQHRWMQAGPRCCCPTCATLLLGYTSSVGDYDEQAEHYADTGRRPKEDRGGEPCLPAVVGRRHLPWVAEWRSWLLPTRLNGSSMAHLRAACPLERILSHPPQNNPGVVSSGTVPSTRKPLSAKKLCPSHCREATTTFDHLLPPRGRLKEYAIAQRHAGGRSPARRSPPGPARQPRGPEPEPQWF